MDRLSALSPRGARAVLALALVACLSSCSEAAEAPHAAEPHGRFEAVSAEPANIDATLRETCDVVHPASTAPPFTFPPSTPPAERHPGRWTWVNYWATWCAPCVQEMPMLLEAMGGTAMGLVFVSADSSPEPLASFRAARGIPPSDARLDDLSALGAALESAGLRAAVSLPVHVLLDAEERVRCVRVGAVERRHVDAVLGAVGDSSSRRPRIR